MSSTITFDTVTKSYPAGRGAESGSPAVDSFTARIEAGTTTVCVIWPDPGGDTVTLDHAAPRKEISDYAYRLTDIPIKNS